MTVRSLAGATTLYLFTAWLLQCPAFATADSPEDITPSEESAPAGGTGACCVDGACLDGLTQTQCADGSCGQWQGAGSTCQGTQCPAPVGGVCCAAGVCDPSLGPDACACATGVWVPDVLNCQGVLCEAVGRCCIGAACQENLTEQQCLDLCGVWGGAGSDCSGPLFPCNLAFGACCIADQCIEGLGPATCTCQGGTWHGGETCALSGQTDCDGNGIVDLCEDFQDCNNNGIFDACDLADGTSEDCNNNGTPDECELSEDCALNFALDCNFDGVLNECEPDCQPNGQSDVCDLFSGLTVDCSGGGPGVGSAFFGELLHNGNCAQCHGAGGYGDTAPNHRNLSRYTYEWKTSGCVFHTGGAFALTPEDYADLEAYLSDLGGGGNGIPDECESLPDCDGDGIADACVIAAAANAGGNADCNANDIPDDCDIAAMSSEDCNGNGIPDECDLDPEDPDGNGTTSSDCNTNGAPDECDIADGTSQDCNGDGTPNDCDPDCNGSGTSDVCDILDGAADCDGNGVPDECDPDCNANGTADACDISAGTSSDVNGNGIPDECEADCNGNGIPDDLDIMPGDLGKQADVDYGGGGPQIPDCDGADDGFFQDLLDVDFDSGGGPGCGVIEHLTVSLDVGHSWVGDLVIELHSPAGTAVTLLSRIGLEETQPLCSGGECCGSSGPDLVVELSDDHAASIETAAQPAGAFHPDGGSAPGPDTLNTFTGEPDCGTWTLRIHDGAAGDSGALNGWTLNFRSFPLDQDCNANGVPDTCDIGGGGSGDCNANGVPDDCEDCNGNGLADACDIAAATSDDCNGNSVPDECDGYRDCDLNGVLDECDIAAGAADCNTNGVPDTCDLSGYGGLFVTGHVSRNVLQYGAATGDFLGEFVSPTAAGLVAPTGVAYPPSGDLLVADLNLGTVQRYDGATAAFRDNFAEGIPVPVDLTVGPDGNIFVLSLLGGQVFEFDGLTGAPLGVFVTLPPAPVPPVAYTLTFGPNGNLFVPVFTAGEVIEFDGTTGAVLGAIGSGVLTNPLGVAFSPGGNFMVSDPTANNIREFDGATGQSLGVFVDNIGGTGVFFFCALSFGPNGNLYMTHSNLNVVAEFSGTDGALVQVLPSPPVMTAALQLEFRPPSNDCNNNGVPDECEDCNDNHLADWCDIDAGTSDDVNGNGTPDECEGADVEVALVVRKTDSGMDTATSLPAADASVPRAAPFVVELWATDRGVINTGLEQVYVNLTFDPQMVQATAIDHRPPFTGSASGFIDNAAGSISDLGGIDAGAGGAGQEPNWARIALVTFDAVGCPAATDLMSAGSALGVSAVDRGAIDPAAISFGAAAVTLGIDCVYNLDGDAQSLVNAGDLGLFAQCWLSGEGDPQFDPGCDFDCSGFVDAGDLGWFAAAWLQLCQDLSETDLPQCRRCDE